MIIGLTYDLRQDYLDAGFGEEETAEFDRPDTDRGHRTSADRAWGTRPGASATSGAWCRSLAAGERWDMVFNICEGMFGMGREAQVPALLDAYQIPYTFSGPLILALALDKAIDQEGGALVRRAHARFRGGQRRRRTSPPSTCRFPLFAKPLAEGTGKGVDATLQGRFPRRSWPSCAENCCEKFKQPVLVETYLPGREFTVGIVGSGADGRGRRGHGGSAEARSRGQRLFLCEQGKIRGPGAVRAGAGSGGGGPAATWPCGPGAAWAAWMPDVST